MSFLYPRTIAVHRPDTNPGAGSQGYSGVLPSEENTVLRSACASIQFKPGGGKRPTGGLPADTSSKANFHIFIPLSAAPQPGIVLNRDIVIDDLGNRYQVISNYWNSLGFNLYAELLQM
jgi:hypothetical protein